MLAHTSVSSVSKRRRRLLLAPSTYAASSIPFG
ncbi:hypothetical protein GQ607_008870 [Colletotrichum asianum]|uniref:Uncharacterized protein n=1 Tax=Colletotrichum asianum TaxID=702518 RepID=A0A8H3WG48_9PEZI|nr:hypothetical protein GQ607_008870 [Colletotrichum asianum]